MAIGTCIPATQSPTTYTGGVGNHASNNQGASIQPGDNSSTNGYPFLGSAFWVNRYANGLWTTTPNVPFCEYIGFSFCLNGDDGDYLIGFTVDDVVRVKVNGVMINPEDTGPIAACGSNPSIQIFTHNNRTTGRGFDFFNLYKLPLAPGLNSVEITIMNVVPGSQAGLSFDIAGPYPAGSLSTAAGIYATLNHDGSGVPQNYTNKIITTQANFLGKSFTVGTNSGYTCPSGYALDLCDPNPKCCPTGEPPPTPIPPVPFSPPIIPVPPPPVKPLFPPLPPNIPPATIQPEDCLTYLDKAKCCVADLWVRYVFFLSRGEDVKDIKRKADKLTDAINIIERFNSNPVQKKCLQLTLTTGGKSLLSGGKILSVAERVTVNLDPDKVNSVTTSQIDDLKQFININCAVCNC